MLTPRSNKRKCIGTEADMKVTHQMKRKSLDIQADRISDLPGDVLCKIVECLSLRDAVRTSVLSHKWHRIWASIPSLVLDDQFFTCVLRGKLHMTHEFYRIVTKVLLQHESPILKFSLSVPSLKYSPDVTQWMPHLSRNGVRDFSLSNMHCRSFELSSLLYSCGWLENLKLYGGTLSHLSKFRGLPRLKSLELVKVLIEYSILNDLIGSCLVLEKLVLLDCIGMDHRHGPLIIDAPNLTKFSISGVFNSLDIKNGENLVSAAIVMRKTPPLVSSKFCYINLTKAQESSSKLEMLALGGHLCKVMFKPGSRSIKFEKVRDLKLISLHLNDVDDFLMTINCIQSVPSIETLKISVGSTKDLDNNVLDNIYKPDWTLHHLRVATISIMRDSSIELKLIEYLLGCSPVLEKLFVSFIGPVKRGTYPMVLMMLNQFTRVSRKVKVVCHKPLITLPKPNFQRRGFVYHHLSSSFSSDSTSDSSDFSV